VTALRALAAALMPPPVVAACSGVDESAGATTTSPVDATDPTEPRTVTVTDFCQVDEQLDSVVGDMQPGADYTDDQLRFFAQVKAVAPPEVAAQVAQVVDELFLARRLFDPAALQDPACRPPARRSNGTCRPTAEPTAPTRTARREPATDRAARRSRSCSLNSPQPSVTAASRPANWWRSPCDASTPPRT